MHTPHFVIVVLGDEESPASRLGITVTKKVSVRAVERNRIKRLVREVFRLERRAFPPGATVVIAKPGAQSLTLAQVRAELVGAQAAMRRAGRRPPRGGR